MNDKLKEAIEVLKLYRNDWSLGSQTNERLNKAIDTVVAELEKPLPTEDQIEKLVSNNVKSSEGELSEIMTKTAIKSFVTGAMWMRDQIESRAK